MNLFVGRKKALVAFNQITKRESKKWLLFFDGVAGIGKSTILRYLEQRCQNDIHKRFIFLNLASTELSQDPIVLLDKIAVGLPETPFRAYSTHLLQVYNQLHHANISAKNSITINKGEIFSGDLVMTTPDQYDIQGGTESDVVLKKIFIQSHITLNVIGGEVQSNKIELSARVDLKKALQDLRRYMRDELSIRFRQDILAYLSMHNEEQLFLCFDNLDQLQKTILSQETSDWLLNSLLNGIHDQNQQQIRVIITNSSAANWPEALLPWAIQQTLPSFTEEEIATYLNKRGLEEVRLHKTFFNITKGHPLCLVLAVDLYGLAPRLGSKELEKYVPDPFHSGELAYNLFQAIIVHTPDEAMKQLLQYGPMFRVLDDEVIDNILSVELGLTKDRIKEVFAKLRDYGILEDSEEIIFQPILHQHTLAHLQQLSRKDSLFPLYRRLNHRAFMFYGEQYKQKTDIKDRQQLVKMTYHEINISPKHSKRIVKQRVNDALENEDFDLANNFVDLVRDKKLPGTSQNDLDELEAPLPSFYHSPRWQQSDYKEQDISASASNSSTLGGVFKIFGGYAKRAGRHSKNYIKSPLWGLRGHLRDEERLFKQQDNLIKDIKNQKKNLERIERDAKHLNDKVLKKTIVYYEDVKQINQNLSKLVRRAQDRQNNGNSNSARDVTQISKLLKKQFSTVEHANEQQKNFYKKHDRFNQDKEETRIKVSQNEEKIQSIYVESEEIENKARYFLDPETIYKFSSWQEKQKAIKLLTEIEGMHSQIIAKQNQVNNVVENFYNYLPQVNNVIGTLNSNIEIMNKRVAEGNELIYPLDGVQIYCEDGSGIVIGISEPSA